MRPSANLETRSHSDPFGPIEDLLLRGEHRAAWGALTRIVCEDPSTTNCHAISALAERLDPTQADLASVKIAVLANFTADPLTPILVARSLPSRLLVRTYVAGFDLWRQEVIDPASGLRTSNPDVILLALRLESLCPQLGADFLETSPSDIQKHIAETAGSIEEAIETLRSWFSGKILVHSFPLPANRALGILDANSDRGQTAAIRGLNERLKKFTAKVKDVFVIDLDRLVTSLGEQKWWDARMWAMAKIPFSTAAWHLLAEEYLRYLRAFTGLVRKVLVLDLDGTLWKGILGEDGFDGIQLGTEYPGSAFVEFQKVILGLYRRGVVLAVNSKNNVEDAMEMIERHPGMVLRPEHFAVLRINWQDKAANMVEIANELGLGLDSMVFIDDSEAECARLRQALPEVLTYCCAGEPAGRPAFLRALGVFDSLNDSEEARERGSFYRQEAQRSSLRKSMQSLEDFYRSLEMELTVETIGSSNLTRAAELTQRTNQFNLTTRRYSVDELKQTLAQSGSEAFGFRLKDKYGDSGMIGLAIIEGENGKVIISSLLISCRVLKRTVEDAVCTFLLKRARQRCAEVIEGHYRPTKKNIQVANFYPERGFSPLAPMKDGTHVFQRPVAENVTYPPWFKIHLSSDSP